MTEPRAQPGDEAYVRTTDGHVLGPLTIEVVEITINRAGRFDRFRFRIDPARGYCGTYPIGEERVFRTRAAAEGAT